MIIDTSAIVAILLSEPDAGRYAHAITNTASRRISAANWLELAMVLDNRGDDISRDDFATVLERSQIEIVPVTKEIALRAREAHARYGRGRHMARLNFGDCIAYATASLAGEPLLFKGNDFPHTDIEPALKD